MSMTPVPSIVSQIVGRCHVGQSNRVVLRYFVSRLKRKYQTWTSLSRADRRRWMQWVFSEHKANRELYRAVQRGEF